MKCNVFKFSKLLHERFGVMSHHTSHLCIVVYIRTHQNRTTQALALLVAAGTCSDVGLLHVKAFAEMASDLGSGAGGTFRDGSPYCVTELCRQISEPDISRQQYLTAQPVEACSLNMNGLTLLQTNFCN